MKRLVDIADVDNLIISAIEETDCDCDNRSGPQSNVWEKVYKALNQLRAKAVDVREAAKRKDSTVATSLTQNTPANSKMLYTLHQREQELFLCRAGVEIASFTNPADEDTANTVCNVLNAEEQRWI